MDEDGMLLSEIIGKTVTDIRCKFGIKDGWLDTAECFIELDNKFYINIPFGQVQDVWLVEVDAGAKTIFADLSDIPVYSFEEMTPVAEDRKKPKQNIFSQLSGRFFKYESQFKTTPPVEQNRRYKVEYHENKLKNIINRVIVDYLWNEETIDEGFFELDSGYLITERYMAPSGTGMAGLHYYTSLAALETDKKVTLERYSQIVKGGN